VRARESLTARMVLLAAALAAVVGIALATLLLTITDMRAAARSARHSAQVLAAANQAEKLLLDLESGARGFALTREERFLQPWRSAQTALPRQTERLSELVADDPAQEALAGRIAADAQGYVDEYSIPQVDAVRRQDNPPSTEEGKRRADALRAQFARFDAREQRLSDTRRAESDSAARRAITIGAVVLGLGVALLLAFAAYLGRAVAHPVRRVALAADRLAAGDLSARVPVHGQDELARLAGSFNAMGESLQSSRDELDSQNTELEVQTAELEDQQQQLASANDELRAQRDELEHVSTALAEETERQRAFGEFADALAAYAGLEDRARATLRTLADAAGAQIGALYAGDDGRPYELLATLGLEAGSLPEGVGEDSGLAGRALAEHRHVEVGHDDATLRVPAFGRDTAVRREVHVPLLYGDRAVGVVSLGCLGGAALSERTREVLEHLADQASVSLSNAFVTRRAERLADINRAVLDTVRDGILMTSDEGIVLANAPARRGGGGGGGGGARGGGREG
jgi:CHASE3 domain sensor protein